MAAPRKYSDAQRQAMFRLFEAGKSPTEIAEMCEKGTAGVSAFRIPRRTVQEIVTAMAAELEQRMPTSIGELESAETVERFPERIARIVDREIDRLEKRQKKQGLGVDDYTKLRRASDLSFDLHKRLAKRTAQPTRPPGATRRGGGAGAPQESAIERLARETREKSGSGDLLSRTHTHRNGADPSSKQAETPASPAGADASRDSQPRQASASRKEDPRETLRRIGEEHGVDLLPASPGA